MTLKIHTTLRITTTKGLLILQSSSKVKSKSSFRGSLFAVSMDYLAFKLNILGEMIMQGTPSYKINFCMMDYRCTKRCCSTVYF